MSSSTQTFLLRPAAPFEAVYPLTLNDSIVPPVNNAMAFIYRTDGKLQGPQLRQQQESLIGRLTSSLQGLLREPAEGKHGYPELLGKMREDPQTHMVSLRVTRSSAVPFAVSHRPDISYASLQPGRQFPSSRLPAAVFAPRFTSCAFPDREGWYEGFWVQLTFIDGGFVLVTCRHHWLSDANGLTAFLRLWFERARTWATPGAENGLDEVIPVVDAVQIHDRNLLNEDKAVQILDHPEYNLTPGSGRILLPGVPLLPRWAFMLIQLILGILRVIPFLGLAQQESQVFHFSARGLKQLQATLQAESRSGSTRLSINDVLLALLWRSIARARCSTNGSTDSARDLSAVSKLTTPINMRARLDPPLPAAWFGNAIYTAIPSMTLGQLVSTASLAEIAQRIKTSAAERATDHHFRSNALFIKSQRRITDVQLDVDPFRGHDILGSNWMWFFPHMAELDLGFGEFQRMRWPDAGDAFNGLLIILPAYGLRDAEGDERYPGGLEVRVELTAGVMQRLKADEDFAKYATWY